LTIFARLAFSFSSVAIVSRFLSARLCGVAYLASWATVMLLGAEAMAMVAVAAVSAGALVLGAPAFSLAIGVERYLRGRLEKV
jgi:hypothetical protein